MESGECDVHVTITLMDVRKNVMRNYVNFANQRKQLLKRNVCMFKNLLYIKDHAIIFP